MPIERNQEAQENIPETRGLAGALLQTAAYEGLQAPIKGVAQVVDQATGSSLDNALTFMKAPVKAEFNSSAWYGQQFGSAAKLVPFIAAFAVTHKGFSAVGASKILGKNSLLIAETAVAGFGTEATFTPLQPHMGQKELHLSNTEIINGRLKNGGFIRTPTPASTGTMAISFFGLDTGKGTRISGTRR